MRNRALALVTVVLLALTAACGTPDGSIGGGPGAPTGKPNPPFLGEAPAEPFVFQGNPGTYGGMMVLASISNPKTFNPVLANEQSTTEVTNVLTNAALVQYNNVEQKEEYGLASSHEVSLDNLVWTFHLRKGVRWSDGQPFTADDVIFNFDLIFDPTVLTAAKDAFKSSDGSLPKVEKVDDYTIRFTLKEYNALFFANVGSVYLVPRHKIEPIHKAGNFMQAYALNTSPEDIVGLGPYRVVSFATDQRLILERNPYYWKVDTKGQRLPYIDRLIMLIVPDENARLLKFQNGEVDVLQKVRPEDVELLKRIETSGDLKVHELGASLNVTYLAFNQHTGRDKSGKAYVDPVKQAWFTNTKFRQAISTAIDRTGLLRTVYLGHGTPIYSFTSPANKQWYNASTVVERPHDPEKAKQMLREIGMEDRNGDGVIEDAKGNIVELTINTNSNNPTRVNALTFLKNNLATIGIRLNAQPLDFNDLISKLRDTHDWDAVVMGWQTGVPPDPVLMKNILLSSGNSHNWFPRQPTPATEWERRIDELVGVNSSSLDLAERKAAYDEIMKIWTEQLPEIDLMAENWNVAAKNRVGNFRPSILPPYAWWNIEEMYLSK
jgi:peptide/nickel transport system substrate-binding protein